MSGSWFIIIILIVIIIDSQVMLRQFSVTMDD